MTLDLKGPDDFAEPCIKLPAECAAIAAALEDSTNIFMGAATIAAASRGAHGAHATKSND